MVDLTTKDNLDHARMWCYNITNSEDIMATKAELEAENERLSSEVERLTSDLGATSPTPKHSPAELAAAEIAGLKARINLLERESVTSGPSGPL